MLSALALILTGCGGEGERTDNPFAERAQTVLPNPLLQAAATQADAEGRTADAERLRRLDEVAVGIWLTPERFPEDEVASYVADTVATAGPTVPVFVLYGIPDRDCASGFSAGGLDEDSYLPWVRAIAAAAGETSVAVLEPDALAAATSCADENTRIELLREAVDILADAGVTTYVDAGHSFWVSAADMAELLRSVGVERIRGFATNVANYQPEPKERAYAAELSGLLGGAQYVIDTGRNGESTATGEPVEEWCNPSEQSLGVLPGVVDDDSGLDALLWIKPPAESDGTCNGGPAAGDIWIDRALELATAAGW